jgi:hypothetical protein
MKPNRISPQSIAAVCALPAIMAFCPTLSAQEESAALPGSGAEQIVTFTLTETYEVNSLKPRDEDGKIISGDLVDYNEWYTEKYNANEDLIEESDNSEYGVKQVTVKISNEAILKELLAQEIILPPITGWALKFVTSGEEPEPSIGGFYAVKSGETPVNLSAYIGIAEEGASAYNVSSKWNYKTTYKYNSDGEETSSTSKETWSLSGKGMTNMGLRFGFSSMNFAYLDGILNDSWSVKSFGTGENQYWQFAPGAAKFDNASGPSYSEEEYEIDGEPYYDESESVLKGAISFSAGKLFKDIYEQYPDFEPNYIEEEYDDDY